LITENAAGLEKSSVNFDYDTDLKMFVQVDLEDQLPDDGAHDDEEGSVYSEISTQTKCCVFAKVIKNAPEGMLPPVDPWDIEGLIENSMMNARQVIDLSEAEGEDQEDENQNEIQSSLSSKRSALRSSKLAEILSRSKVQETYKNHQAANICFKRQIRK